MAVTVRDVVIRVKVQNAGGGFGPGFSSGGGGIGRGGGGGGGFGRDRSTVVNDFAPSGATSRPLRFFGPGGNPADSLKKVGQAATATSGKLVELNKKMGSAILEFVNLATWSRAITRTTFAIRGAGLVGSVPVAAGVAAASAASFLALGGSRAVRDVRSGASLDRTLRETALAPGTQAALGSVSGFGGIGSIIALNAIARAPVTEGSGRIGNQRFRIGDVGAVRPRDALEAVRLFFNPSFLNSQQRQTNTTAQAATAGLFSQSNERRARDIQLESLQLQGFQNRSSVSISVAETLRRFGVNVDPQNLIRQQLSNIPGTDSANAATRFGASELRGGLLQQQFNLRASRGAEQIQAEREKLQLLQQQVQLEQRKASVIRGSLQTLTERFLTQTPGARARDARSVAEAARGQFPNTIEGRQRFFELQGVLSPGTPTAQAFARAQAAALAAANPPDFIREAQEALASQEQVIAGAQGAVTQQADTVSTTIQAVGKKLQELGVLIEQLAAEQESLQGEVGREARDAELAGQNIAN